MKGITIFSGRIAKDLIHKGFKLVNINPDKINKIKTIFYFEDTETLRKYLKDNHNIHL